MPSRKRSAEDGPVGPTLVVRGRYRVPTSPWARRPGQSARRRISRVWLLRCGGGPPPPAGRMTLQAAKDRALLMVSDAQYEQLLEAATKLPSLRAARSAAPAGASRTSAAHGAQRRHTLCVGDVLRLPRRPRRARAVCQHASGLRLQVPRPASRAPRSTSGLGRGGKAARALATAALILTLIPTPIPTLPSPSP